MNERIAAAVARLIAAGIAAEDARTEVRVLLAHTLGISRTALFTRDSIAPEDAVRFDALVTRRANREPLAYLTGEREFYGLPFTVTPAVLIPRPETEFVVERVLRAEATRVADIGTGSGCIAVAVAAHRPGTTVFAVDVSTAALAVAAENARRNGVADRVRFVQGDLLAPLAGLGPFDAIASNPPYIAPSEAETLAPEVRVWEPSMALFADGDGLAFYRRLAVDAPPLLAPGGLLVVEVGQGQADAVAELWRAAGLDSVEIIDDYAGIGRVVAGTAQVADARI